MHNILTVNELRIGNFLFYEETIDDHEPRQITISDITMFEAFHKRYLPIPLTEEWLLKFGFEKDKEKGRHGYRYSIGHQDFRYVISKDWRETTSHHFGIWCTDSPREFYLTQVFNFASQIVYVHELQNLFFALTREELTYIYNKE